MCKRGHRQLHVRHGLLVHGTLCRECGVGFTRLFHFLFDFRPDILVRDCVAEPVGLSQKFPCRRINLRRIEAFTLLDFIGEGVLTFFP
jgi:hypothetical protein